MVICFKCFSGSKLNGMCVLYIFLYLILNVILNILIKNMFVILCCIDLYIV